MEIGKPVVRSSGRGYRAYPDEDASLMEIGKPIVRVARREEFDQTSRDADARQYIEYYLDNPDYVLIQVLLPLPKALLLDTKFDIPEESLESVKEGLEEGVRLARQHYAAPEGD